MAVHMMPVVSDDETKTSSAGRPVIAVISAFLVVASVYAPVLLGMNQPPYELNVPLIVRGVLALVGFAGLVFTAARPAYLVATVAATAIPAVLALGFLLLGMLLAWTSGVHTFWGSWGPISNAFAYTAPFFLPTLMAAALLVMRRRAAWAKVLVVVVGIGVLYALSVYRWFFG